MSSEPAESQGVTRQLLFAPRADVLKISPRPWVMVILKGCSDPFSSGACALVHVGGLSSNGNTETGTTLLLQAVLSKWYFHTVPGTHTPPGSRNLSAGTENKSLVADASKETDQEEPISQAACPSAGHTRAAAQECLPSPPPSIRAACSSGGPTPPRETPKSALEENAQTLVLQAPWEGENWKSQRGFGSADPPRVFQTGCR